MPDLVLPSLPESLAYVWDWFAEVQSGQRLEWQEIRSWSDLMNKQLTTREASLIRQLSIVQHQINNSPE